MNSQIKDGNQSPLETTRFDRVNSFLLSAVGTCGTIVCGLFLVWLAGPEELEPSSTTLINLIPVRHDHVPDEELVLFLKDFPEDLVEREVFEDVIESVPAITETLTKTRAGGFSGDDLLNTSRRGGFPEFVPQTPPRSESRRWEVNYAAENVAEYAQQLDHLGIELGALSLNDNRIVRFSQLSGAIQQAKSSRETEQQSLYFAHKRPRLKIWDKSLVRDESLDFEFDLVHFFSKQATAQMRDAELNYVDVQAKSLSDIQRTSFEIVPSSDGWKIRVANMEFIENAKGQ